MPAETLVQRRTRTWRRDQRCRQLGFRDYRAYLRSRQWQAVRDRYWASRLPRFCALCETLDGLELHHRTYERVGEEDIHDLIALCAGCHRLIHDLERRGDVDLDFGQLIDRERAVRNRAEQAKRQAEAMPPQLVREDRLLARSRNIRTRLKQAISAAIKQDADINVELDEIDALLRKLEHRAQEPPTL